MNTGCTNLLILFIEMPNRTCIYLYQNSERLLQNIKKEAEVMNPADYLDKINSGYLEYIKSQTELNVLIIDVSDKR
jgi:deoxyadenosine/deoxycytidine kinase